MNTLWLWRSPGRGRRPALALGLLVAMLALVPPGVGAFEHGAAVHTQWRGGVHVGVYGAPGLHPAWYGGVGGRWEHGWHGGHFGWWYIDAGVWTLYPYYYPYYPYYPYAPYYAYPAPYPYAYPPESTVNNSNLPAPPAFWYYCDAARAYYPNVPTCPGGWRAIAATPPATPPATAPAAPPASAPPAPPPQ